MQSPYFWLNLSDYNLTSSRLETDKAMDHRRRSATQLEARLAQLDERLRAAKMTSDASLSAVDVGNRSQTDHPNQVSHTKTYHPAAPHDSNTAQTFRPSYSDLVPRSPTVASNAFTTNSMNMSAAASGSDLHTLGNSRSSGVSMGGTYTFSNSPAPASRRVESGYVTSPLLEESKRMIRGENSLSTMPNSRADDTAGTAASVETLSGQPSGLLATASSIKKEVPMNGLNTTYHHSKLHQTQSKENEGAFEFGRLGKQPPTERDRQATCSTFDTYNSPWREAAFKSQIEATADLQRMTVDTRSRRLESMLQDVDDSNKKVAEADLRLLWYTARKDTTAAEMHRYLKESNDKVASLEREEMRVLTECSELKVTIEGAVQQLSEVREATARAVARSQNILAERNRLEAEVQGLSQSFSAKEKAQHEWRAHHESIVMSQLLSHTSSLKEDVAAARRRLETREGALATSRIASETELKGLASEISSAKNILEELNRRSESLKSELSAQKQQASVACKTREKSSFDSDQRRRASLSIDLNRVQEENMSVADKARQQEHTIAEQLEDEVLDLRNKLEKVKSKRSELMGVNAELSEKCAGLSASFQSKQALAPVCDQYEADVDSLINERSVNRAQIAMVQNEILNKQDGIRKLELEVSRFNEMLDEESRLKTLLASLSQEMASSASMQQEEVQSQENSASAIELAHTGALARVAMAEKECERVKASNAAVLDSLTRKLNKTREELSLRERSLDELVAKNSKLQHAIIQFEEEKRRIERDAMARKEAASRAAKAALMDLA